MTPQEAVRRLRELAGRARRLPPPDHRDPERFHVERSELASDISDLTREISRIFGLR